MVTEAPIIVEYERPKLYRKQRQAIFCPERYGIIEASTKTGKTVGCMVWIVEQAVMAEKRGQNYWWVAPFHSTAKIAFTRCKSSIPAGMYEANDSDQTITLINGSVIWFKSGEKPDSLYGEDVYAAVIDEASRVREESWHAVRSTLTATRGPVRIIGNVKGRKNWVYKLARQAQSGRANWSWSKLTAYDAVDAGLLKIDEINDAKESLPDHVFKELYLAEPSEDGSNPFDIRAIQDCIGKLGEGPAKSFGWDLAKSVDWTVGIGLNQERQVCHFSRFQQPWHSTVIRIRSETGRVNALVDSTGVGDPILEELQQGGGNFEGFKFSSASKQQLMEGLVTVIQQRKITIPEGPIVDELMEFEYEYSRTGVKYSAPAGLHDDCVMSLALANMNFSGGAPRVRWMG